MTAAYPQVFPFGALALLMTAGFPAALAHAPREEEPGRSARYTRWACAGFGSFALAVIIAAFR